MAIDFKSAQAFQLELRQAIDRVPSYRLGRDNQDEREAAKAAVVTLIESKGGKVRSDWNGTRLRLFGLSTSSTSGLEGACRNWIAQLTIKSMAAQ